MFTRIPILLMIVVLSPVTLFAQTTQGQNTTQYTQNKSKNSTKVVQAHQRQSPMVKESIIDTKDPMLMGKNVQMTLKKWSHPQTHWVKQTKLLENKYAPINLAVYHQMLYWYKNHDYQAQITQVAHKAIKVLNSYVKKHKNTKKLAIVFDVDDTCLSNWPEIAANNLGYVKSQVCKLPMGPCGWDGWVNLAEAKAIDPVLKLFKQAKKDKVSVFFITGRSEYQRAATLKNLTNAGYYENNLSAHLYLRKNGDKQKAALYKTPIRKQLEQRGYTIVENVGDQNSDLDGGHAVYKIKFPNPFYFVP